MGPLIVAGQIHIHVYLGNGLLLSLVFIKDGNRISDPFYTNLINVYISIIFVILDVSRLFAQQEIDSQDPQRQRSGEQDADL